MYDVQIRLMPPAKALTCEHNGPYMEIGKAFQRLSEILTAGNLFRPGLRMVALYYDDPSAVPADQLRSRAGVIFPEGEPANTGLESVPIAGGEYAVLRHKGPYAELSRAYDWLYGQWLPQSGRNAANSPVLEEYLNTPMDTVQKELLTDICLPLS